MQAARDEIWKSWRRTCTDNANHPRAAELFDPNELPAFHDPFAGGGAIPLEAQRLGLEAYASDLNPVAVLIDKAMMEIPPHFADMSPVNPQARTEETLMARQWAGAAGLAEDIRHYSHWMGDEAEKRVKDLYPNIEVTAEMAKERPDLRPCVGQKLTVLAWIWARTVKSPNPAFKHVDVPLASTFMLSIRPGKEAFVEPIVGRDGYRFIVKAGKPGDEAAAIRGTKSGSSHSAFLCLMSGVPMTFEYLRAESKAGRLGERLMAIVAEGDRERVFLTPTSDHEAVARRAKPQWKPETEICHWPGRTNVVEYGMKTFGDLFTTRQLVAMTTFSDLVPAAIAEAKSDGIAAGLRDDDKALRDGGNGASAYSEAIGTYLALIVGKLSDLNNSLTTWKIGAQCPVHLFARQAIPMTWDYAEANPLSGSAGSWASVTTNLLRSANAKSFASRAGTAVQADATTQRISSDKVISTDPPYYDNIGYADLSDFFYVWLRRSLRAIFPELFSTLAVPKAEELVATPYGHATKAEAELFFLQGMTLAMHRLSVEAHPAFPITIYYAFKQAEKKGDVGVASTGWETFLGAVLHAGLSIGGTWPMRTENDSRMIGQGRNALASSIVLACRPRAVDAPVVTRRDFVSALRLELSGAIRHLQASNIEPVDLAQAGIGPGMAVFTRFKKVIDAEGNALSVREALALINQTLDEVLAEQEGDFDSDSRWALSWFEQHGFVEGEYGVAETLSTARNTSVGGLAAAGIVESKRGKVRLLKPGELKPDWNPNADRRLTAWETVHQLIRALDDGGDKAAASLAVMLGTRAEAARELAYRLYMIAERKKRTPEALAYNGLVQSWPEILRLTREATKATQADLFEAAEI